MPPLTADSVDASVRRLRDRLPRPLLTSATATKVLVFSHQMLLNILFMALLQKNRTQNQQ
jgi:broad specificity phosphatase PhoE